VVHDAKGANVEVQVPAAVEYPDVTLALSEAVRLPVLVMVTGWAAEVPVVTEPKFIVAVDNARTAAVPTPVTDTDWVFEPSVKVTVPVPVPIVVGVNDTVTVQVPPIATMEQSEVAVYALLGVG
jgi:S-formylglutathione hydrolase FrmB